MIFLAVGSHTPFDRLVRAVDLWNAQHRQQIIAQIGSGHYKPEHLTQIPFCSPAEFSAHCRRAELIVSHAGMGTVLTALEFGRPMLLMPRQASLNETRNDHQLATVQWLVNMPGITVASDEQALLKVLDNWHSGMRSTIVPAVAQARLIAALRTFINA